MSYREDESRIDRELEAGQIVHMVCQQCGWEGLAPVSRSYEQSDADGNRGIWVYWIDCPKCGEEWN